MTTQTKSLTIDRQTLMRGLSPEDAQVVLDGLTEQHKRIAELDALMAQPAKPLTEEEIQAEYKKVWDIIGSPERASKFARAIEALIHDKQKGKK